MVVGPIAPPGSTRCAGRVSPGAVSSSRPAGHFEARTWEATDWAPILLLYNALLAHLPTAVVALHRAIAYAQVAGPSAALAELDALAEALGSYHLFHATRAHLLRELDRIDEARRADEQALRLTGNIAERALLEQRLT